MTQNYTILFDLDGTLVDTAPDLMNAHNHVMTKYGYQTKSTEEIRNLVGKGASALIGRSLWGNAKETGLIVKQIRAMGMEQPIFGGDRLVSDKFLEIAGEDAEGVIATYPYNPDSDNPRLVAFTKKYEARFGSKPDSFAAHAYDGMNILLDAQIEGDVTTEEEAECWLKSVKEQFNV